MMIHRQLLRLSIIYLSIHNALSLRMMTFNTWISGAEVTSGLKKIAKHIAIVNPDIVALQELTRPNVVPVLLELLGKPWTGVQHCNRTAPDTAILSRHKLLSGTFAQVDYGMGVKIQLPSGKQVSVWSLHLIHLSYGPHAANNKQTTSSHQILTGEYPQRTVGRVHNIIQLISSPEFRADVAKSSVVPLIVAGDFNSPSDLDWIEANKDQHGDWAFEWPATKILREISGLKDSYREVYPDPRTKPGLTWSTVDRFKKEWDYTIPEPMDRIDFIFYLGSLRPINSFTYGGDAPLIPIPKQWDNDYPSDHYAVITDFERLAVAKDTWKSSAPMCADNFFLALNPNRSGRLSDALKLTPKLRLRS